MRTIKEKSFGIIPIFKNQKNKFVFCLIQHAGEHWGFPKGHRNEGEDELETAKRELEEETGIKDIFILNNKTFTESYSFEKII